MSMSKFFTDRLSVTVNMPSGATVYLAPEHVQEFLARNPGATVDSASRQRILNEKLGAVNAQIRASARRK